MCIASTPKKPKRFEQLASMTRRLTPSMVSPPANGTFVHLGHVGFNSRGQIETSDDVEPGWTMMLEELQGGYGVTKSKSFGGGDRDFMHSFLAGAKVAPLAAAERQTGPVIPPPRTCTAAMCSECTSDQIVQSRASHQERLSTVNPLSSSPEQAFCSSEHTHSLSLSKLNAARNYHCSVHLFSKFVSLLASHMYFWDLHMLTYQTLYVLSSEIRSQPCFSQMYHMLPLPYMHALTSSMRGLMYFPVQYILCYSVESQKRLKSRPKIQFMNLW